MISEPQVSFITVCYSGFKNTYELIESLRTYVHSVSYKIIVADNASREDEATKTKELYPDIVTLRSESNLGFSGGNNLGIRVAKKAYIFLINDDTYIGSDGSHYLTERLENQRDIEAVSPKIRFTFPPQNVQSAGSTSLSAITIRNEVTGFSCPDDDMFGTPHMTPYLHGAALMVRRGVIEKVGEMPKMFFLCYKEMDWCIQMTNAGYELWYEPRRAVFHKGSRSTRQLSELHTFYTTRNRLLYIHRNRKGTQRLLSILYQSTIAAGRNSLQFAVKGRFDLFAAIWKGAVRSFSVASPIR